MPLSTSPFSLPIAVIGSGPGGISAAKALIRRGLKVVMLDGGQQLDADRQAFASDMKSRNHTDWTAAEIDRLTLNPTITSSELPKKLVFGSDFYLAGRHPFSRTEADAGVTAEPTLARGGYTVAWGGAMLPIHDDDMRAWPFRRSALEASYRRVLADMPFSAGTDSLADHFPLFAEPKAKLRLAQQAQDFMADIERQKESKNRDTLLCGQARLAVRTEDDPLGKACQYCGYCLSGCAYKSIYTLDQEVTKIIQTGKLDYRGGVAVLRLEEKPNAVTVFWHNLATGAYESADFSKVFLAAGAINSSRIMLQSERRFGEALPFLDSQKFIMPMLRFKRAELEWPNINTLPSLFMETRFPDISENWAHMQISPVNDFVLKKLGLIERRGWKWRFMAPGIERLMIAFCGLHSSHSGSFDATLQDGGHDKPGTMLLRSQINPESARMIHAITRRMMLKSLRLKTLFLPLPTIGKIGTGHHIGGSFPMADIPDHFGQTDTLGRPFNWSRVHIVDSAVLSSIPSTTVALLIMANADRIATEAVL